MSVHFDFEILQSPESEEFFHGNMIDSPRRSAITAISDSLYGIGADAAASMCTADHVKVADYLATADKFVDEGIIGAHKTSKRVLHVVKQTVRFLAQQFYLIQTLCSFIPPRVAAKLIEPRTAKSVQPAPLPPVQIPPTSSESMNTLFTEMFCLHGEDFVSDLRKLERSITAWNKVINGLSGEDALSMRRALNLYRQMFLHHRPPIAEWEARASSWYTTRRHWAEKAAQAAAYCFLCNVAGQTDRTTGTLRWLVRTHGQAMQTCTNNLFAQSEWKLGGRKKIAVQSDRKPGTD